MARPAPLPALASEEVEALVTMLDAGGRLRLTSYAPLPEHAALPEW